MERRNFVFIAIIPRACLDVCKQVIVLLMTHALRRLCYRHYRCRLYEHTVSYSSLVRHLRPFLVLVFDACLWTVFYRAVLECFFQWVAPCSTTSQKKGRNRNESLQNGPRTSFQ